MIMTASDMDLRDMRAMIDKMADGRTDGQKALMQVLHEIAERQGEISALLAEAVALMRDGHTKPERLTIKRLWGDYIQPGGLIVTFWLTTFLALRHAWNGGDIGTALSAFSGLF